MADINFLTSSITALIISYMFLPDPTRILVMKFIKTYDGKLWFLLIILLLVLQTHVVGKLLRG